jgi:hypothetical protein
MSRGVPLMINLAIVQSFRSKAGEDRSLDAAPGDKDRTSRLATRPS